MRLANGPKKIILKRDAEGYREFRVEFRVLDVAPGQGPYTALACPGLPLIGSRYQIGSDADYWCWCRWDADVTPDPADSDGWPTQYIVSLLFANKPMSPAKNRCQDFKIEDPLLQPPKVSGSGSRYSEEAWRDRFGKRIMTSSHEPVRGPQVEFDANRPQVKISMNVLSYNSVLLAQSMQDKVNNTPLWGWPRRYVKLSSCPFQRLFYGGCLVYYTLDLEFDINPKSWDRELLDEGTKALHGEWNLATGEWRLLHINPGAPLALRKFGNASNPSHFSRYKDRFNDTTRVILDGHGQPVVTLDTDEIKTCVSCPDGAPQQWVLLGFDLMFAEGAVDKTIRLTYQNGCEWRATKSAGPGQPVYQFILFKSDLGFTVVVDGNQRAATNPWVVDVVRDDVSIGRYYISSAATGDPIFYCQDENLLSATELLDDNGLVLMDLTKSNQWGQANDVGLPGEVIITPYLGTYTIPIRVEKYDEANFLMLGIPGAFV